MGIAAGQDGWNIQAKVSQTQIHELMVHPVQSFPFYLLTLAKPNLVREMMGHPVHKSGLSYCRK